MRIIIHDLEESCGNALKELCETYSIHHSYNRKEDNEYEVFAFNINYRIVLSSSIEGVTVAIKAISDYVFIASDMFYYIEII